MKGNRQKGRRKSETERAREKDIGTANKTARDIHAFVIA